MAKLEDCCIGEAEEYKYLEITIEGGKQGGFNSMGDRMKEAKTPNSNVPIYAHIQRKSTKSNTHHHYARFVKQNNTQHTYSTAQI